MGRKKMNGMYEIPLGANIMLLVPGRWLILGRSGLAWSFYQRRIPLSTEGRLTKRLHRRARPDLFNLAVSEGSLSLGGTPRSSRGRGSGGLGSLTFQPYFDHSGGRFNRIIFMLAGSHTED